MKGKIGMKLTFIVFIQQRNNVVHTEYILGAGTAQINKIPDPCPKEVTI